MDKYDVTYIINGREITVRVFAVNICDACFRVALNITPDANVSYRDVQIVE